MDFAEINRRVASCRILGNVEAENSVTKATPLAVVALTPSMLITWWLSVKPDHAQLKTTAARHPQIPEPARLPMFARFSVGGCVVGIVHGDADSLAGWRFDASALSDRPSGMVS